MAIFSSFTREKILNLLLEKGLAMTIPKTKEELSNYKQVNVLKKILLLNNI